METQSSSQKNANSTDFSKFYNEQKEGVNSNSSSSIQAEEKYLAELTIPRTARFIIHYSGGLIKTAKQANYVFIGFFVILILFMLYLFFGGGGGRTLSPKEREELFRLTPPPPGVIQEVK